MVQGTLAMLVCVPLVLITEKGRYRSWGENDEKGGGLDDVVIQ